MRQYESVAPLLCGFASAVFLAGVVFLGPGSALAGDPQRPDVTQPSCTCPSERKPDSQKLWPRPKLADVQPDLDDRDELAALEAMHVALSEVGDGVSYVWHRPGGQLSGVVQPTVSFKDVSGKICRHISVVLTSDHHTRKTEGVACRLPNGAWQLDN